MAVKMSAGKSVAPVAGAGASNVERLPLGVYRVVAVFVARAPDGFVVDVYRADLTARNGIVAKKTVTGWVVTDGERAAADNTPLEALRAFHRNYIVSGLFGLDPEAVFLFPLDAEAEGDSEEEDDVDVAEKVYRSVRDAGLISVAELEERFGPVRDMVARLWAEGRVEIMGDPAGPLPGYVRLNRRLVRKYGYYRIPAEEVEKRYKRIPPRLVKVYDRRDGKKYYMLLLRGDDIIVHPSAKARVI